MKFRYLSLLLSAAVIFAACTRHRPSEKEEIRLVADSTEMDTASSISLAASQIATYPNEVILTGLNDQRLVTIYRKVKDPQKNLVEEYSGRSSSSYYYDDYSRDYQQFFMPGIDLQLGYNLINIAHYNFKTEKTKLLFDQPVLIRSIYYPSFVQDSLNKKPINRNYFLISVYNEDTSKDSLLNKSDLRRFFFINADASEKRLLLPVDYSVVRSQYDAGNDVMYLFARHDSNGNGRSEPSEPLHVFWISLAKPENAKRVY